MKTTFWKSDWFTGLIIIVCVLGIDSCTSLIDNLERFAYDAGVQGSTRVAPENISIIAIDEQSIENIGRWPWSRDIHADMIERLQTAGAKVIAYTPIFAEQQIDPGLDYINQLSNYLKATGLNYKSPTTIDSNDPSASNSGLIFNHERQLLDIQTTQQRLALLNSFTRIKTAIGEIDAYLQQAQAVLNVDKKLIASIADAGNVITPMWLLFGEALGNPDQQLPKFIQQFTIDNVEDNIGASQLGYDFLPLEATQIITPIPALGKAAHAVGNINNFPDVDGGIRTEPLIVNYYGTLLPSYALLVAAKSLNLTTQDIKVILGEAVEIGRLKINTDGQLKMHTFFYEPTDDRNVFSVDSFFDIVAGKVATEKFKNQIVIVGATASGISKPQRTPINPVMSEAETIAHTVGSLLNEDFFLTPTWAPLAKLAAFLIVALYILFVLPRLKAFNGAAISAGLLLALFIIHYILMTSQSMWIQLMQASTLLVIGYTIFTTKRFLLTERGKLHSDIESAESNKMLGLAFQGQGQLDMAFEKFRKCPKNDSISEVLYNLALDYERKRQFSKAGNVYRYIAEFNPQFRDVQQRIERSDKMENTVVLGGNTSTTAGTLILDNDAEKPRLGRYEVEKELGKGAMGIVYLGRDPKISRVVAIKTMALSQEFDEDELDDVKERFFREAETAGRLNHPNIVTIYDAGEEHDLAYIAMEFLQGHDLARYTKANNLLPLATSLDIIKKSAQALNYAHKQNVVHRDIKPANVMYEPDSGQTKLTDFGIARITDSSKTKTGMVLGTPSYMSPEQLAGKKVDGRSDLFSLGVMLFQLVTGQLPFKADSMASLMYKITNDPHPNVLDINSELPAALDTIVTKALQKNADDRYQTGNEFANDLEKCSIT